jgi:hypothetical protein
VVFIGLDALTTDGDLHTSVLTNGTVRMTVAWTGSLWWHRHSAWFAMLLVAVQIARVWILQPTDGVSARTRQYLQRMDAAMAAVLSCTTLYSALWLPAAVRHTTKAPRILVRYKIAARSDVADRDHSR